MFTVVYPLYKNAMQTRRKTLASIGSVALGTTALATLTSEKSEAMAVSMDGLDVPDTDKGVTNDVAGVVLRVDGSYEYSTSVEPTRLVLRLEARPSGGSWSQIDALAVRSNLTPSESSDYQLQGNLVKHPELSATDFTPSSRGESKRVQVDVRVRMSVSNKGQKLGETQAEDSATITVSKTTAQVELGVSGDGSVGITTAES